MGGHTLDLQESPLTSFLPILFACSGSTTPTIVPATPPTDTAVDDTGDTASVLPPSQWDQIHRVLGEPLSYVDAAWIEAETPTFITGSGGFVDPRDSNSGASARAQIERWVHGESEPTNIGHVFRSDSYFGPSDARVVVIGDVTGDGAVEIAANLGAIVVRTAILPEPDDWSVEPPVVWGDPTLGESVTAVGFLPIACDADRDGQPDLCTSRGFDLGPIDGTPEATWDPGVPYAWERIAIGRTGATTTAWVARSGGVTAIDLGQATGNVDLDALPFWAPDDGDFISALVAVPTAGDDLLAVCSGVSTFTVTQLRILDGFQDAAPILTLSRGCDDLDVGDFDGDGDPELAVASDSTIQIIELDGTVRSTLQGVYDPGSDGLGSGMDSADVDGDGREDLIAAARESSTLYITYRAIETP